MCTRSPSDPSFIEGFIATPPMAPVPEPSTWVIMLLGFAGLGYAGNWRRRAAPSRALAGDYSRTKKP
jgi:hypothetical protein